MLYKPVKHLALFWRCEHFVVKLGDNHGLARLEVRLEILDDLAFDFAIGLRKQLAPEKAEVPENMPGMLLPAASKFAIMLINLQTVCTPNGYTSTSW